LESAGTEEGAVQLAFFMRKAVIILSLFSFLSHAVIGQTTDFTIGPEGWRIVDVPFPSGPYDPITGGSLTPTWLPASGNPGAAIESTDRAGVPVSYFQAPAEYLGDKSAIYGGSFSYDLNSSAGGPGLGMADVVLAGGGLTLIADAGAQPAVNTWTHYSVSMSEAGWTKEGGGTPTTAEFQSVLGNITAIRIRAEYYDTAVSRLDNVTTVPEPGVSALLLGAAGFGIWKLRSRKDRA
jgi:hypothetical protein